MEKKLMETFQKLYGGEGDIRTFFSPGRVNLIGEHTDYNGGHVFPCALTLGTYGIARKRNDRKIRFYSDNFSGLGVMETSLTISYRLRLQSGPTIQRVSSGRLKRRDILLPRGWMCWSMVIFQTDLDFLLRLLWKY